MLEQESEAKNKDKIDKYAIKCRSESEALNEAKLGTIQRRYRVGVACMERIDSLGITQEQAAKQINTTSSYLCVFLQHPEKHAEHEKSVQEERITTWMTPNEPA
jgi:hypothetical protein